jgi:predicted nucleotidyltransferase
MHLMPASMIQLAREAAVQRARADSGILAAYLTGSVLDGDPFIGDTADIDLVFVHAQEPKARREIISLSPEIHLDIKHNPRREYSRPRELRLHPWLGPEMYDPLLLYERDHFFQFVQAGLRDKFHAPENTLQRARRNAEHARQMCSGLQTPSENGAALVLKYLKAVNHAANAVAILNGKPLAERRLLLQFPARAEAAGLPVTTNAPRLAAGLLGLLGAPNVDASALAGFLPEWEKDFQEAASRPNVEGRIHPARLEYYKKAFEALLGGENPQAVLWPLIHTWSLSAAVLPPERQAAWQSACQQLGLAGEAFEEHVQELGQYLDGIEELLEGMAAVNGV